MYRVKAKGKGKRVDLSRRGSNDGTNDHPLVSASRSLALKSSRSSLNLKSSNTTMSSPTSRRTSVKEGITFQPVTDNCQPQMTLPSTWNTFEQGPEHNRVSEPFFSSLAEDVSRLTVSDVASTPPPFAATFSASAQHDPRKPRLLTHSSSSSLRQILNFGAFSEDTYISGSSSSTVKWKLRYTIHPIIISDHRTHPNCSWLSIHDGVLRIWKNRDVS